jgi:predicted negative regulator of RcsB-dependent stress response
MRLVFYELKTNRTKIQISIKVIKMTDENQTLDQTLDQTLNKTDFGTVINENKKPILIAGIVILIAIVAYSVFNNQSQKAYQTTLAEAYSFDKEVITAFNEDKIKSDVFLTKMKAMPAHIKGTASIVPSLFASIDKLIAESKTAEAITILESWNKNFSKGSFSSYFMGLKLAPLYEDAQSYDKAIDVLQGLVSSQINISKDRVYLDLGRIYSKKGDATKAAENFNFILKNFKDSESAKMAKLYLGK